MCHSVLGEAGMFLNVSAFLLGFSSRFQKNNILLNGSFLPFIKSLSMFSDVAAFKISISFSFSCFLVLFVGKVYDLIYTSMCVCGCV